jgi:hypothetical protein
MDVFVPRFPGANLVFSPRKHTRLLVFNTPLNPTLWCTLSGLLSGPVRQPIPAGRVLRRGQQPSSDGSGPVLGHGAGQQRGLPALLGRAGGHGLGPTAAGLRRQVGGVGESHKRPLLRLFCLCHLFIVIPYPNLAFPPRTHIR